MKAEPCGAPLSHAKTWATGRYTCRLTATRSRPGALVAYAVEWSPAPPTRLTAAELAEYRRGRDAALKSISEQLGINAAVVDL